MANKYAMVALVVAVVFGALTAQGAVLQIGGTGAISTNDPPYGPLGLLSEGEVATALFEYTLDGSNLILTVTNTSPAIVGTDSEGELLAPVISDIFFSAPSAIIGMQLLTVDGAAAGTSGWDFIFSPDGTPSAGFGFLMNEFDGYLAGGPGPGSPNPTIASINGVFPNGPGDVVASPVDFVFSLIFEGGSAPAGWSADWFISYAILGNPDYIAAAKFMGGANGGSGTVTNYVPEPATLIGLLTGLSAIGVFRRRLKA